VSPLEAFANYVENDGDTKFTESGHLDKKENKEVIQRKIQFFYVFLV